MSLQKTAAPKPQGRKWDSQRHPEKPYQSKKKEGETITFLPLESSSDYVCTRYIKFRRPVYDQDSEKDPESYALQTLAMSYVGSTDGRKLPKEQILHNGTLKWDHPADVEPCAAEFAMLKFYNAALLLYREQTIEQKMKRNPKLSREQAEKDASRLEFHLPSELPFFGKDKIKYGMIALVENEIGPFAIYTSTFDPTHMHAYYPDGKVMAKKIEALAKSDFIPRKLDKFVENIVKTFPGLYKTDDFSNCATVAEALELMRAKDVIGKTNSAFEILLSYNLGVKQYCEMTIEHDDKLYLRYPKYITQYQIIAQTAQGQAFQKDYIVWKPIPILHEDYQHFLPAEFGDHFACHPEDADIARGWFKLGIADPDKRATLPFPAIREFPDPETGEFVYVSVNNPDLCMTINVLQPPLDDIFSKPLLKQWSEAPKTFAFEPANEETLKGGFYYEHPDVSFSFEVELNGEKRTINAKAEKRRIYGITVNNINEVILQASKPAIRTEHGFVTLEWQSGHLWDKPINLERMKQDGSLAFGSEETIAKMKKEADILGVPYRGKTAPAPYWPLKDHPDYKAFVSYAESKGQKTASADDEPEAPSSDGSKAKDIDV